MPPRNVADDRVALCHCDVAVDEEREIRKRVVAEDSVLDVSPAGLGKVWGASLLKALLLVRDAGVFEEHADGLRKPADRPVAEHHWFAGNRHSSV